MNWFASTNNLNVTASYIWFRPDDPISPLVDLVSCLDMKYRMSRADRYGSLLLNGGKLHHDRQTV